MIKYPSLKSTKIMEETIDNDVEFFEKTGIMKKSTYGDKLSSIFSGNDLPSVKRSTSPMNLIKKKIKNVTFSVDNMYESCEFRMADLDNITLIPVMTNNLNNLKIIDKKPKTEIHQTTCNAITSEDTQITTHTSKTNIYTLTEIAIKFRHLVFSPFIPEAILIHHISMIYKCLMYATKLLKGPSVSYLLSKQIILEDQEKGIKTPKKTLILDLDETLIKISKPYEKNDYQLKVIEKNPHENMIGIRLRPFCRKFIDNMAKIFEIIIFTSDGLKYSKEVSKILDPDGSRISAILDKSHCLITKNGLVIKDLRIIKNRDLKNMVIVDNLAHSFGFQLFNGIPILEWSGDDNDMELKYLENYLIKLSSCNDIQKFNKENLKLHELLELQIE